MAVNIICGTPRSGSTLLCNLLNQNPDFYASSTSCMAHTIKMVSSLWSRIPEVKSELIRDREATENRIARSLRSLFLSWYADVEATHLFDKDRAWNHYPQLVRQLFPKVNMFVCVRDLREVFASIEKQHAKNPILDELEDPLSTSVYNRADRMFSDVGIIGQNVLGVEDLIRRNYDFVHFIKFNDLVNRPQEVVDYIYSVLGLSPREHDFNNIVNTSVDLDGLYLYKYPHQGCGKVEPPKENWRQFVPEDIANLIMGRFPGYNAAFGYN